VQSLHSAAYRHFLTRLVAARRHRRLTQAAVATALKIPRSRVSRMESGERRVDIIELAAFAKLYKRPLSYFVDV
jgi:transcriptional regulator with XRE-family HTH domain